MAEVLITLGIIGIVAEMTIPTLIQNTNDAQYKTGLKKTYSVLSQAQLIIATNNGGSYPTAVSGCDQTTGTTAGATCMKNAFKAVFQTIKDCDAPNAYGAGNCAPSGIRYLNGGAASDAYIDVGVRAGFIASDGMSYTFYSSNNCSAKYQDPSHTDWCGLILVDVNGFKPPNQWGKDIYEFIVYSSQIQPLTPMEVYVANTDDCSAGTNYGYTCAYKYITTNQ